MSSVQDTDGDKFQSLLCPGLLEASESTSICPLLTPSPSHVNMVLSPDPIPDPESVSMCPLLESPSADIFRHPLDPLAGLAYQQRTPDIDNQPDFIGLCDGRDARSSSLPGRNDEAYVSKRGSSGIAMLESSSSSSSGLQDNPASVQLLNHHYQHLTHDNNEGFQAPENGVVCLEMAGHKVGVDYCFMHWNWPVIRTACFWTVLSITVACFCIVVGMIVAVPKKCQPPRSWHQGTVFYEIFPASFQDSNHDGIGDIIGVTSRTEYLKSLGISAIRLNSIFPAAVYPEAYENIINLTSIDRHLGKIDDVKHLLTTLHSNNISVIIDIPIYPLVKSLKETKMTKDVPKKDIADEITNVVHNHRSHRQVAKNETGEISAVHPRMLVEDRSSEKKSMLAPYIDGGISGLMKVTSQHLKTISKTIIEDALEFWFGLGVDGVYIKGLEHYINDPHFLTELRIWNKIKLSHSSVKEKILMADYKVLQNVGSNAEDEILTTFDLLDAFLELSNGTHYMTDEIVNLLKGKSFTRKSYSWLHWNIGNVNTRRLGDRVVDSFGAITFQALLPGTISVFYGDEIGLTDAKDVTGDHHELQHMYQLSPMQYINDNTPFTPVSIVPWMPMGYAEHSHVTPLIRVITQFRETIPSIYMNKVCKDDGMLLNSAIGFVDDSLVVLVRSYPRRHTYSVFYNTDVKDITRDFTHLYYGGEKILESSKYVGEDTYVRFKNFTLSAGMAVIIKLDK